MGPLSQVHHLGALQGRRIVVQFPLGWLFMETALVSVALLGLSGLSCVYQEFTRLVPYL